MEILMIVNPNAGKQQINKKLPEIRRVFEEAGHPVRILYTRAAGDAAAYVSRFGGRCDLIVCCGGDGTLSETVGGLMYLERRPVLGYIPCGTTNDFAIGLGLPKDPVRAAHAILDGRERPSDVGVFDSRHFVYVASFGAFSRASYATPQSMKNALGHLAYVLEGTKELASLERLPVRVETESGVFRDEYIMGFVSNATSVGGIVRLKKERVRLDDGLFEMLLIKYPRNALSLHKIVIALNTLAHAGAPEDPRLDTEAVTFVHTRSAVFHFDRPADWSLDGEHAATGADISFAVAPRAVVMCY